MKVLHIVMKHSLDASGTKGSSVSTVNQRFRLYAPRVDIMFSELAASKFRNHELREKHFNDQIHPYN